MFCDLSIGVVGGMGSYATVHLFKRIVDMFPAEKDWERPRIIIDNNTRVPSRVRGILYNEKRDEIVYCLNSSINNMLQLECDYIIVGCHTAHYFLNDILEKMQMSDYNKIVDIIDESASECYKNGYKKVRLLASEGTVEVGIYKDKYLKYGISVINPRDDELVQIRTVIEDVKQNKISSITKKIFAELVCKDDDLPVILGCSELPVVADISSFNSSNVSMSIIDPLDSAIMAIKNKTTNLQI